MTTLQEKLYSEDSQSHKRKGKKRSQIDRSWTQDIRFGWSLAARDAQSSISSAALLVSCEFDVLFELNTLSFLACQRVSKHAAKQDGHVLLLNFRWDVVTKSVIEEEFFAWFSSPNFAHIKSEFLQCNAIWLIDSSTGQVSQPLSVTQHFLIILSLVFRRPR